MLLFTTLLSIWMDANKRQSAFIYVGGCKSFCMLVILQTIFKRTECKWTDGAINIDEIQIVTIIHSHYLILFFIYFIDAARECAKDMKEWRALVQCNWTSLTRPFFLALCSFGPSSRALVVLTWRGVGCRGINCSKGTISHQGAGVKYMG